MVRIASAGRPADGPGRPAPVLGVVLPAAGRQSHCQLLADRGDPWRRRRRADRRPTSEVCCLRFASLLHDPRERIGEGASRNNTNNNNKQNASALNFLSEVGRRLTLGVYTTWDIKNNNNKRICIAP